MATKPSSALYAGLMSGTSADGVDLAVVDFAAAKPVLVAASFTAYPATLHSRITSLYQPGEDEIDRAGSLSVELALFFAECIHTLLTQHKLYAAQIRALGSHGQTIRHRPRAEFGLPFSLQIGCPSTLAHYSGITTVADFRAKDIALGGQGAPLAPAFHQAMFADTRETRAVVNIGGISNVTLLTPGKATLGFDTGPGNALMDAWCQQHQGTPYDRDGQWAASGLIVPELLEKMLAHPYFALPAPKSTGREEFSQQWLLAMLQHFPTLRAEDVQATLLEVTAQAIYRALAAPSHVYLCGGGVYNHTLVARLTELLTPATVTTTLALGVAPDWVEAMAFAWLAKQTLASLPGNLPSVTGAAKPAVIGGIYPP